MAASVRRPRSIAQWASKREPGPSSGPLGRQRQRIFLPFVLPALLVYVGIYLLPTAATIVISFFRWRGSGPMTPVGLANYTSLINDTTFQTSVVNTFKILIIVGLTVFGLSFALTIAMRQMAARRAITTILFFPNLVSGVALAILWGYLFQSDGLVNSALHAIFGIDGPAWLAPDNRLNMIMLALTWISTGFYVTILMAALDRIPSSYYEDADIAGANAFQRFRFVTLPLSWDVVSVAAILWTISSVKIFDFFIGFAGGNAVPSPQVWTSSVFVYAESFGSEAGYQLGYASASAVAMLVLVAVLVLLLRRFMRRDVVQF